MAAKACWLTQPTVSQHVAAIESFLGLKLFDRNSKEIHLTQAGQLLYRYATEISALFDALSQSFELFKGKKIGTLNLGASTIPGDYIVPHLLGEFKHLYPGLKTNVLIRDSKDVIQMLLDRHVDLAVVGTEIKHNRLKYTPIMPDELVLIIPLGHRWWDIPMVEMSEVIIEPFVMRENGSGTRLEMDKKLKSIGIDPSNLNVVAEVGSTTAVKEAVESRLGISFVSRLSIEKELKLAIFKTVRVRDIVFSRWFYLVRDIFRTSSPLCSSFSKYLIERTQT